jgi:hypothetical protein
LQISSHIYKGDTRGGKLVNRELRRRQKENG